MTRARRIASRRATCRASRREGEEDVRINPTKEPSCATLAEQLRALLVFVAGEWRCMAYFED